MGLVAASGDIGRAEDVKAAPSFEAQVRGAVVQVYYAPPVEARLGVDILILARARVEVAVVVAGDDDFVFMGECVEPVEGLLDGFYGAVVREVAGVEQQVAGGDVGGLVGMRVADADDPDRRPVLGRVEGGAAQIEEDGVDEAGYDC